MDENGNLYGWGSNATIQLSHEEELSKVNNPLLCSYIPLKINKNLQKNNINQIITGEELSILVTKNRQTDSCEVFSFGNNLRGQLGIGEVKHAGDVNQIESLSNYIIKKDNEEQKVLV